MSVPGVEGRVGGLARKATLAAAVAVAATPLLLFAIAPAGRAPALSSQSPPAGRSEVASLLKGQRELLFEDLADGSAVVRDAGTGATLQHVAAGDGGFVRTALRLLVVERRRYGLDPAQPFVLASWTSGRVTIEDRALGKTIELTAFGTTNARAFAQLLETRSTSR